jgi:predicted nucleic acid-binding protein
VSLYLDASVLVALFVIDPASARAAGFLASHSAIVLVSDFGAAEFSWALARRVRMHDLTREDALLAFEHFDTWTTWVAGRPEITTADIGRRIKFCDASMSTFARLTRCTSPSPSGSTQHSSRSIEAWLLPPARSAWRS